MLIEAPAMLKAHPGCCEFCPKMQRVPAVHRYTDVLGFPYALCERHFAPILAWLRRKEERERRQLLRRLQGRLDRGGILRGEDQE